MEIGNWKIHGKSMNFKMRKDARHPDRSLVDVDAHVLSQQRARKKRHGD